MIDIDINFVERGTGSITIIFVHGFTCSLSDWSNQMPSLSDRYRCVAVDLPGHGDSAAPREATIETLANSVNHMLDKLALDEVVLIGHSMGCRVISEMARQSRARVRGLVYIDGSIVADENVEAAVSSSIEIIDRVGMRQFLDMFYHDFFAVSTALAIRESIWGRFSSIDIPFAQELWLNMIRWDALQSRSILTSLDVPALVIQSTFLNSDLKRVSLSPGQSSTWVDEVSKAVDGAVVQIIENVGHFPMLEAPEQTNEVIHRFIQKIRGDVPARSANSTTSSRAG